MFGAVEFLEFFCNYYFKQNLVYNLSIKIQKRVKSENDVVTWAFNSFKIMILFWPKCACFCIVLIDLKCVKEIKPRHIFILKMI